MLWPAAPLIVFDALIKGQTLVAFDPKVALARHKNGHSDKSCN
jgi:hypothetical protein